MKHSLLCTFGIFTLLNASLAAADPFTVDSDIGVTQLADLLLLDDPGVPQLAEIVVVDPTPPPPDLCSIMSSEECQNLPTPVAPGDVAFTMFGEVCEQLSPMEQRACAIAAGSCLAGSLADCANFANECLAGDCRGFAISVGNPTIVTPEPATVTLVGFSLVALGVYHQRKRERIRLNPIPSIHPESVAQSH